MKTILITAYAVNPYKGSEDGTGWNIPFELSKEFNVIVFTRENNAPAIEEFIQDNPLKMKGRNIQFYYFDLPKWSRFWKKWGQRTYVLYYKLWQYFIVKEIRSKQLQFDLCHSLNFHSDNQPHFLWKLNKPTIWGPVGSHPPVPKHFLLPFYSFKSYLIDRFYNVVKKVSRSTSRSYRKAVNKTSIIIGINSRIYKLLAPKHHHKTIVIPAVGGEVPNLPDRKKTTDFTLMAVGRFVPMKGFDLTLAAFAHFIASVPINKRASIQLKLIGKGPELKRLKKYCSSLRIDAYVSFVDWMPQTQLKEEYASASAFIFPSHEGAGMVVPEAMSYGLPIICLNNFGPGELIDEGCGLKAIASTRSQAIERLAAGIMKLYCNPDSLSFQSRTARVYFKEHLTWKVKGQQIASIYHQLLDQEKTKHINHINNTAITA